MNNTISLKVSALDRGQKRNIFSLKLFLAVSFIFMAVLLGFDILQISAMAEETALVEKYEGEIKQISKKNNNLEIAFSRENSLGNIESVAETSDFERVAKIDYIKVLDTSVAVR